MGKRVKAGDFSLGGILKQFESLPLAFKLNILLCAVVLLQSFFILSLFKRLSYEKVKIAPGIESRQERIKKSPAALKTRKKTDKSKEASRLTLKDKAGNIIETKSSSGKIAIVLDDWGYNLDNLGALKKIEEPLTLAILPRQAYSRLIAESAGEFDKEIILHLPLEPKNSSQENLEPQTIMVTMNNAQVLSILNEDLKNFPGIKGVSNHMGSLATETEGLMSIILTELKKRGLYFLDSLTGRSVCDGLAAKIGLPYAKRHIFLDNKNDEKYIYAQLESLAKISSRNGFAVGIGHDRVKTLEVLLKAVPDLRRRGYRFVFVSELLK